MGLIGEGVRQAFWLVVTLDPEVLGVARRSLAISGTATLLSLVAGLPAGTALGLARFPRRGLMVSLVNTGLGLPPVVVGLCLSALLGRGGPLGALELLYTPPAIVLAQFVIAAPVVTGLTRAQMQQDPRALPPPDGGPWRLPPPGPWRPDPGGAAADACRAHGRLRGGHLRGRCPR